MLLPFVCDWLRIARPLTAKARGHIYHQNLAVGSSGGLCVFLLRSDGSAGSRIGELKGFSANNSFSDALFARLQRLLNESEVFGRGCPALRKRYYMIKLYLVIRDRLITFLTNLPIAPNDFKASHL